MAAPPPANRRGHGGTGQNGDGGCGPFPPRHAWTEAIGSDGALRWQTPLTVGGESGDETQPPLVVDGLSISAQDGALTALDLGDGHQVWRWTGGGSAYGMWPSGDTVIALTDQVSTHAHLTALDPATGHVVWQDHIAGMGLLGDQFLTGDGGLAWMRADGTLQVIDLADGHVRWSHSTGRTPALAAAGGNVLLGKAGTLTAYDAGTGNVRWSTHGHPQEPALTTAAGLVLVSSATMGGDSPTALTAIDPGTGHVRWQYDAGTDLTIVGGTSDGLLVARYVPDRRLTLLDVSDGKPRWTVDTALSLDTQAVFTGDSVVTVEGGVAGYPRVRVVSRSLRSGDVRWQLDATGAVVGRAPLTQLGSLVVVQEMARHPDQPGAATAYDIATGHHVWSASVPTIVQAPATAAGSVLIVQAADPSYGCAL